MYNNCCWLTAVAVRQTAKAVQDQQRGFFKIPAFHAIGRRSAGM